MPYAFHVSAYYLEKFFDAVAAGQTIKAEYYRRRFNACQQ